MTSDDSEDRKLFAAIALAGILVGFRWQPGVLIQVDEMANDAVALADALMRALKKW